MTRIGRIIIYSIFSIINISIMIILFCRDNSYKLPFFLTLHSFWFNCFYFFSCLVIEIRTEIKKSYSEKFLPFLKNTLFKYTFTFTCFITINFYIFLLLGQNFMKLPDSYIGKMFSIFLHGGEFLFIITEFFISEHSFIPDYTKDILIIKTYFIFYFVLSLIAMNYNIIVYEFMNIISTSQLIVLYFISSIILLNFYLLYQYAAHKKNSNSILSERISIRRLNYGDNSIDNTNNINNLNINNTTDKEMNFIGDYVKDQNIKKSINEKKNKDDVNNEKIKRNILTNY